MLRTLSSDHGRCGLGARRRSWAAVGLATLLLCGAAAGPSRADMFTPSVKDQIKLGNQAAQQVLHQYRVVHDERAAEVERMGRRLLDELPRKDREQWDWHFYLIQSKEINAFALPGGNTFFFTGLYDRLKTEDELAAVMGHEMTHVRKEHWAHMAAAAQKQPQPELQLRADKATRYEVIAQVMAAAQSNGLTKLGFVTEPGA